MSLPTFASMNTKRGCSVLIFRASKSWLPTSGGPPQPGSGSDGGELSIDERGRRAGRGGDPSSGQRADILVHGVPTVTEQNRTFRAAVGTA